MSELCQPRLLGNIHGLHVLIRSKEWLVLRCLQQLDLVSHPVVEQVQDHRPDCLEVVRLVLVILGGDFHQLQVHHVDHDHISRVLNLSKHSDRKVRSSVLDEWKPSSQCPFHRDASETLIEHYLLSRELLIHLQGDGAVLLFEGEVSDHLAYFLLLLLFPFVGVPVIVWGTILVGSTVTTAVIITVSWRASTRYVLLSGGIKRIIILIILLLIPFVRVPVEHSLSFGKASHRSHLMPAHLFCLLHVLLGFNDILLFFLILSDSGYAF